MKKKIGLIFGTVILVFVLYIFAWAQSEFVIENFHSDITINKDASIDIKEKIEVDVPHGKHGINREIPLKYKDKYGNNLKLKFELISITDENGKEWKYETSRSGRNIKIKIGDPDVTISGLNTYVITYKVQRAINYFSDHDELYWNVTGTQLDMPIENCSATVYFPENIPKDKLQAEGYTGEYGSKSQDLTYEIKDGQIDYQSTVYLTIVAGWPKEIVQKPSTSQQIFWFSQDNWAVAIPFLVFFVLFYLWWTRGREPEGRKTIIAQYEPPDNITAGELGILIDQRADMKDISATVIDLAVRGYLKIEEIEGKGLIFKGKDYKFIKNKEFKDDKSLKEHEKEILRGVFGYSKDESKLSDLKEKFYTHLPKIKKYLYQEVVLLNYFKISPDKIRGIYLGVGIAFGILGFVFIFFIANIFSFTAVISMWISALIIIIFSFFMPRRTKAGTLAYEHALGLKEYIKTAERYRMEFAEKEKIFEKLLPYAMVFGVAEIWAGKFKDIYKTPPDWYSGSYVGAFSASRFASSLNGMSKGIGSTFRSAPSGGSGFGGGGFSGGGFGGGGGSGW